MNSREAEERKWEICRQMEAIRQRQEESDELEKELEYMEEESYWQDKRIKEVNDDLLSAFPKDSKLQNLLMEKEELLHRKISFEKIFFEECRDMLSEHRKKTEDMKEVYEAQLMDAQETKGEEE
ncbi:MAG: hypothetical protein MR992_05765 [Lachnospiraceae bacterium]|nr:hypothetical protein [Lachnospiraceae bacterium]MDD7627545.1 hypothetical protein [Lachnospiraceae bacterium]MDY4120216.1 hypothetical protein [Lachnospiraceae bacterium]